MMATEWEYPQTRRWDSVVEDHFGTGKVPNPYGCLEDPDSMEIKEFVKAQNVIIMPFLAGSPVGKISLQASAL